MAEERDGMIIGIEAPIYLKYNFTAGAYIEKRTHYFATCTFAGALLSLAINLFAVPQYGMIAATWATTLSYGLMAALLFFFVRRFYPIPYQWADVLKLCVLGGGIFAAWYIIPDLQVWWKEALLLLGFIAGVFILRVVSPGQLAVVLKKGGS